MDNIISAKIAAQILGITQRAVFDLLRRGTIRGEKLGREWMVSRQSVEAYKQIREARLAQQQSKEE